MVKYDMQENTVFLETWIFGALTTSLTEEWMVYEGKSHKHGWPIRENLNEERRMPEFSWNVYDRRCRLHKSQGDMETQKQEMESGKKSVMGEPSSPFDEPEL